MKLSGIILLIVLFDMAAKSWILTWSSPALYAGNEAVDAPLHEERPVSPAQGPTLASELFFAHAKYLSPRTECQACHD